MFKKAFTFTVIFLINLSTYIYGEETWKITSLDWQPYSGSELTNEGNSVQKLRELLRKKNIRLIVEFYPWKRSQQIAKKKDYVGYFPAWPEEVYEGFIASPAVDWSEVGVLKQAESDISFDSIDSLFRKYKVGIVSTYTYPDVINDAIKKYLGNVEYAMSEIQLVRKLSVGRHQVAITDPLVMEYVAEKEGISNIEPLHVITQKELVLAFREGDDNQHRIELLEKLLH